jgi:hypothetical protein
MRATLDVRRRNRRDARMMQIFRPIVAMLFVMAPAAGQAQSTCEVLQKYLGKAAIPFMINRGPLIKPGEWQARRGFPEGNCIIIVQQPDRLEHFITCTFNEGKPADAVLSSYHSMEADIQNCLDGLETKNEWSKRDTSWGPDKEMIWTLPDDWAEKTIRLSGHVLGPNPPGNLLVVKFRVMQRRREE